MADPSSRVAMISGANRGIGAAIADHLSRQGWRLSLGVRDPARLPPRAGAAQTLVCGFDARRPASEKAWVEATVERFGRIDAVIANAGITIPKTVIEAEDEELDDLFQVNVRSPLRLVRAAWPWLTRSGRGRVVTIVSLSGLRVKTAKAGLYSTSKFAALAMTHAIRHAGWEDGIRATAVCPGFVATDMAAGLTTRPPEDMTQPADVARLVGVVLDLPNSASVAELPINSTLEEML
ncbi:SDR family NAD(P)-dependent oxidoreductase [Labrys monachus]|uniref:NAD(P)-dependent dehydrogenase (Short-subunit alcohol dehydrogenase family) n=1 Tax=Labrys monachus TaxID=217067 RepID=A0ABU0FB99_9HYPH|nr:SDR family NAD(P)-dependent oxidoreductase [Labrys monachus]MDQ0391320.1 NAD(P)-dependent dehydrogenase (short-subunit alcohol dehydrogenase family) [Labrys monachus]